MIGRYAQLGVYRELLRSRDFLRILAGGVLAVASYLLSQGPAAAGYQTAASVLAGVSVALNGVPNTGGISWRSPW